MNEQTLYSDIHNSGIASTIDDIYPSIYYADKLITFFQQNFFSINEESFSENKEAQSEFLYNYEEMAAQVYVISQLLYDIRLKSEFALGIKTKIVEAHIKIEAEMQNIIVQQSNQKDGAIQ